MDHIKIQEEPLVVEELVKLIKSPTSGGLSVFIGTTRDNFENKKVLRLEYEAYTPMAEKEMKKICASIRSKWPDVEHICVYHRLGLVPVCEASVIIAISSPHRKAAIQAVEYAIDTLKATVPIWKKEVYAESEPEWKENKECAWKSSS